MYIRHHLKLKDIWQDTRYKVSGNIAYEHKLSLVNACSFLFCPNGYVSYYYPCFVVFTKVD